MVVVAWAILVFGAWVASVAIVVARAAAFAVLVWVAVDVAARLADRAQQRIACDDLHLVNATGLTLCAASGACKVCEAGVVARVAARCTGYVDCGCWVALCLIR